MFRIDENTIQGRPAMASIHLGEVELISVPYHSLAGS
jgi:hypothetical protein